MTNPKDLVGAKKAPLRFVPPALYIGAAEAMESGATRYGPMNWREQPVSAVTYAEAMLRHIFAWLDGQDYAEDSGIHHLKHVAAGDGIMLDAIANGTLIDDRFTPGPAAKMLAELDRSTKAPVPQVAEQDSPSRFAYKHADGTCAECAPDVVHTSMTIGYEGYVEGSVGTMRFVEQVNEAAVKSTIEELRRPILCNCGPVRARYGDHLITCPRFEDTALRDLEEPHRDIGGEG